MVTVESSIAESHGGKVTAIQRGSSRADRVRLRQLVSLLVPSTAQVLDATPRHASPHLHGGPGIYWPVTTETQESHLVGCQ